MEKCRLLSLVMLLCSLFLAPPVQAQDKSDGKRVTMELNGESLSSALKKLEGLSGYKILFSYDDVDGYQVNGRVKDATVESALQMILKDKPFEYVIDGRFINVNRLKNGSKKPVGGGRKISGVVISKEDGLPVIGASVRVEGSDKGAATDIDGRFTLNDVPDGSNLLISYIGMKTQTLEALPNMEVLLESDSKTLGDVVVTGIFKKSRESYTGAVSTIDKEQLNMYRGQNLIQTLRSIDASINIPVNNLVGSNPNALPQMNIRGSSSLPMSVEEFNESTKQSVNTPLIIMDGFEISLEKLMDYNDEEIESITILKDASATAIYGSRGANGVIVVTTKEPEPGKLKIQAQVGLNVELPDLSSYDLLNAADKLRLEKMVGLYEIEDHPSRQFQYDQYYDERLRRVLSGVDVDWLSKPLRNGIGQRYNLRLEGGSEQFRWATALKYNETAGAMKGSSRRVFTGDITLMYRVKNLIFRNYTSISTTKGVESKYGSFQNYVNQQPYNEPYDENGQLVRYFDNLTHSAQVQNPLYDASLNTFDESRDLGIINNFSIEWNILDGLTLRGQLGISADHTTSDYFLPAEHSYFNTVSYNTMMGSLRKGLYDYSTGDSYSFDGNVTLSYSKLFADRHQVYVGLDYSMAEDHSKLYTFSAEGYTNDDLSSLANARQYAENSAPGGSRSTSRRLGFTGNVNYTYDNRYYIDGSYRVDGSSQFGSNKRYAPFWSVGVGWNIHNEKALFGNKTLNNLRIKASYGVTGSLDFSASNVMTTYKYYTDSRYLNWSGAQLLGLGNPDLTWQSTKQWNVGLEFGLFQNRIKGEFNVYNKITNNLLSSMDLPRSMGFPSYVANVGEVKNVGYEASLTAYLIRDEKRDLNWMISAQLVYDKNKITRLSEAIKAQNELYLKENVEVSKLFYEGRPQNSLYAVRSLGIDPSYGYEMFLDKDGNITRTWNPSDKVYMGSADPLYRGNASTMLMWKDFTFNISFGYHWGGKMYNSTLRDRVEVSTGVIASRNVDARVLSDRWKQPGDAVFFKNFDNTGSTYATSRYIMDDNVFEIQTISLQYRWHSEYLRKVANLQTILFGLNMSNVAYFSSTKYERGTDYPFARNLVGTITFMF